MATSLSFGPVAVQWPWTYQNVVVPNSTTSQGPWTYSTSQLTNGTGAGNANLLYTAQTNLAVNTATTLDLSAITNAFGSTVNFARLKAMYFENTTSGTSTNLVLFGAGTNPFLGGYISAGTQTLRNGMHLSVGVCQDATGYPVGTGVNLKINNADLTNTAVFNIGLCGCSA